MGGIGDIFAAIGGNQPVTKLKNQAIQEAQSKADLDLRAVQIDSMEKKTQREQEAHVIDTQAKIKNEQMLDMEFPIDSFVRGIELPNGKKGKISGTKGQVDFMYQVAQKNKLLKMREGMSPTMSIRGGQALMKMFKLQGDIRTQRFKIGMDNYNQQIKQAEGILQSGDPKAVKEFTDQLGKDPKTGEPVSPQAYIISLQQKRDRELQMMLASDEEHQKDLQLEAAKTKSTPNTSKFFASADGKQGEWVNVQDPQAVQIALSKGMQPVPPQNLSAALGQIAGALQKGTQTAAEQSVIDLNSSIGQLNDMSNMFKDEYLMHHGKGIAWLEENADKLGLAAAGITPTKFLEDRAAWFAQSQDFFLKYRKMITGVAGGQKEMDEIKRAVPSPDDDSPAKYRSKLEQTRKWARVLQKWKYELASKGLSITQVKEIIEQQDRELAEAEKSGLTGDDLFNRLTGVE